MGKRNSQDSRNDKAQGQCCTKAGTSRGSKGHATETCEVSPSSERDKEKDCSRCSTQGKKADKWTNSPKGGPTHGSSGNGRCSKCDDRCAHKADLSKMQPQVTQIKARTQTSCETNDCKTGCDLAGYGPIHSNQRLSTGARAGDQTSLGSRVLQSSSNRNKQDEAQQLFAPRKNKGVGDTSVREADACQPFPDNPVPNQKTGMLPLTKQDDKTNSRSLREEENRSYTGNNQRLSQTYGSGSRQRRSQAQGQGEALKDDYSQCKPLEEGILPSRSKGQGQGKGSSQVKGYGSAADQAMRGGGRGISQSKGEQPNTSTLFTNNAGVTPSVDASVVPPIAKSAEDDECKPHMKCCPKGGEGGKDCVICKPYIAAKSPLTIKYKAIVVDPKPTLAGLASQRFESRSKASLVTPKPSSRVAQTVAISSLGRNLTGPEDLLEREFQNILDMQLPMLWIFGYTQASIIKNKEDCLNLIATKNNLAIINISQDIGQWMDVDRNLSKKTVTNRTKTTLNSSAHPLLQDKIYARAREILQGVNASPTATLSSEDICEVLKLLMILAINSNGPKGSPPAGFVIDNFPLSTQEGIDAETLLFKSMVCLYFSSIMWSQNKEKEPPFLKPTYHLREMPYSEKEAENGADYYGFKTIKIINAEDLEELQVGDINSLVRQHLEGQGLTLHKVMRKLPAVGRGSGRGHDYLQDGTARKTAGTKSNIIMDHNDFIKRTESAGKTGGSNVPLTKQFTAQTVTERAKSRGLSVGKSDKGQQRGSTDQGVRKSGGSALKSGVQSQKGSEVGAKKGSVAGTARSVNKGEEGTKGNEARSAIFNSKAASEWSASGSYSVSATQVSGNVTAKPSAKAKSGTPSAIKNKEEQSRADKDSSQIFS